ncbi:hypothetical protein DUNSADRAFT_10937 [Dunaliella salina]|uniref:Uncharacterized protein n=1 Tax=Dunaliella salina TaxID=3046 RepID=A0ABQ7GEI6_DUNSA|nr:hypothetical protein DUNSADRAFT_10937 [Dunaliella salina]|eukprot:KAF5833016.1 hypothetical protein DUNSADRAFT_10937 [Dunaliella salina]
MQFPSTVSRPPLSLVISNHFNSLRGRPMERQPEPTSSGQLVPIDAMERMFQRLNQEQQQQQQELHQQQQQQQQENYRRLEALIQQNTAALTIHVDSQFERVDRDVHGLSQKLSRETMRTDILEQQQHRLQQQQQQQEQQQQQHQQQQQQMQELQRQQQQQEMQQRSQQGLGTEAEEAIRKEQNK